MLPLPLATQFRYKIKDQIRYITNNNQDEHLRIKTLKLLRTILQNIIQNPENITYRRLKFSNVNVCKSILGIIVSNCTYSFEYLMELLIC